MSNEIEKRLRRAATTAPVPTVTPEAVWSGVRRRRALHGTVGATAAVAAIAVAATGAFGAIGKRDSLGTAQGPESEQWAAVTSRQDGFACGRPVPVINDPVGTEELHLEVAAAPVDSLAGPPPRVADHLPIAGLVMAREAEWSVVADMVNASPRALEAGNNANTSPGTAWLVRDGVVVAFITSAVDIEVTGGQPLPVRWQRADIAGDTVRTRFRGPITPCGGDADAATALPSGPYDIYVTQDLSTTPTIREAPADGWNDVVIYEAEYLLTLTGWPWSVTLE